MTRAAIQERKSTDGEPAVTEPDSDLLVKTAPSASLTDVVDDSSLVDLVKRLAGEDDDLSSASAVDKAAGTPPASPVGPGPTSPAGAQPKINFAALQRARQGHVIEQAQESVLRLFGGATAAPTQAGDSDACDSACDEPAGGNLGIAAKPGAAPTAPLTGRFRLPLWIRGAAKLLDRATAKVNRFHPLAASLLGGVGILLAFQAVVLFLLAHLGWI